LIALARTFCFSLLLFLEYQIQQGNPANFYEIIFAVLTVTYIHFAIFTLLTTFF